MEWEWQALKAIQEQILATQLLLLSVYVFAQQWNPSAAALESEMAALRGRKILTFTHWYFEEKNRYSHYILNEDFLKMHVLNYLLLSLFGFYDFNQHFIISYEPYHMI